MQVSVETTSGLERKLTIAIPAEKIESEIDARIKKVAPQVRLDGFRAGKVPPKVVRQRFGDSIRQEVLGEMMSSSFHEAVEQENLKPAGQPSVEPKETDKNKDFSFVATFEVYPEFTVNDISGAEILKPNTVIDEKDIDEMIDNIRKQRATFAKTDKAADEGDKLIIDYQGFKGDEAFEGGTAEDSELVLGSGSMIPGFEEGLVGASAGEEKELKLTFPEDYHAEDLKGAEVVFKVKVKEVQAEQLPEIDDDFLKLFGIEDGGIEALKEEVEKNMQRELKQALKTRVKNQVMDALLEKNSFDIPSSLINQEVDVLRNQMFQQFGGQASQGFDANLLPAELFEEQATKRVSLGLILGQFIQDKGLKADPKKVTEAIEEIASSYEASEEVKNYYYNNREQLAQIEAMVLEDQLVDYLLDSATVADENLSYKELMQQVSSNQA